MTLLSFSRQGFAWHAYVKRFGYARQSSGSCDSYSLDPAANNKETRINTYRIERECLYERQEEYYYSSLYK